MPLEFQRMHANGDDFVIVDMRGPSTPMASDVAHRLHDRHRGIGSNQLAIVSNREDEDARLAFWNADGTSLDACGRATRGVADLLIRERNTPTVSLRTNRGLLFCARSVSGAIAVDLGPPSLDWHDIPLSRVIDTLSLPLPADPTACRMGNPHCTYFVDDLSTTDVAALGRTLEVDPLFPSGPMCILSGS
jgi:diaminopimelate epimerase